jgi:uncharacterized protein (DUF1697 family)
MGRYVAFLGGINVGGHRVSMADLEGHFVDLGFDDVSTFIASGNVVFSTGERRPAPRIAAHLEEQLGYAVPTFVRSDARVVEVAGASPFGDVAGTVAVGFLDAKPPAAVRSAVAALATDSDALEVIGSELWWHLPNGFSGSKLAPKALARAGLGPLTTRNLNTVQKLAAKLA